MADRKNTTDAQSWSAYWAGAEAAIEPVTGGAKGEALEQFWTAFFKERLNAGRQSLIDLACGAGPVALRAAQMAGAAGAPLSIHCADYSPAAIRSVRNGVEGADIAGFVADAAMLPLPDQIYDIATSQFGIEYAGAAAFDEAARIIRPGGTLAAIIHLKGGAIEAECAANLDIVLKTQKIEFLPRARDAFEAGFAVLAGRAPRERLQNADRAFAPAVKAAKKLLESAPKVTARDFLQRLYADLAHMYPRLSAYAPEDIEAWISRGEYELKAYEARMSSMVNAARSRADIDATTRRLCAAGLTVAEPEVLEMGDPLRAAAWALVAERRA